MDPLAPPPQPGQQQPDLRNLVGSFSPETEQWLLHRLRLGQQMRNFEPHMVSGLGPGIAWGLADATRHILGARYEGQAMQGLQGLAQRRSSARQGFFDLAQSGGAGPNEVDPSSIPSTIRNPDEPGRASSRLRSVAMGAAATGDPALEHMSESITKQQQLDREYAQLEAQINHQHQQLQLESEKEKHAETQRSFERGHTQRTEQEWVTSPAPELGGFTHTSKHTGEAWLIIPGQAPIQISKGAAPGQPSAMSGPGAAAAATGGKTPPYVKLNESQSQAAVRGQAGATGIIDALSAGFPTTDTMKSIPESLAWKGAEHGFPQLASPDDQARVAAWDAVFDPVARMRAGLRIPEEQMSRMRMELRPQPGESWDNHVAKTKRILDTFRAEAGTLPPVKSAPILEELDRAEAMLPKTKEDYAAFNKNAVSAMRAHRAGKDAPQSVVVPPRAAAPAGPGAPLRKPQKASLSDRLRGYYGGQ